MKLREEIKIKDRNEAQQRSENKSEENEHWEEVTGETRN